MPEGVTISLAYSGPLAYDGTLPVADVISALQGFSGAYGKLASRLTPNVEHHLRVTGIHHSSFTVMLASLVVLGTQPTQQQLLEIAVDSVKRVVTETPAVSVPPVLAMVPGTSGQAAGWHVSADGKGGTHSQDAGRWHERFRYRTHYRRPSRF